MTNVLTLVPSVRHGVRIDGDIHGPNESHFLNFAIDGQPLSKWIDYRGDVVTTLNRPWLHTLDDEIAHLTGRIPDPDLLEGRIALLRCGECGDIGCGAVTAQLEITPDSVTWCDFAWDDGLDDSEAAHQLPPLSFVFDRESYLTTLEQARARVTALPYDALSHEGRKFLWPLQRGWRLPRTLNQQGHP